VPRSIRLLPGEVFSDTTAIDVESNSNHTDTVGVYVDLTSPGGCTPNGRLVQTTVTLPPRGKTTVLVPVNYSCADPAAANGMSYTWTAVADHGADDLAFCGPGALQSPTCRGNLNNDDESGFAGNERRVVAPQVIAQ